MFFNHTSQYETWNGSRRLSLVKRRRIWCIMEYRGEDSYVPHHLVFWSDFLSVTFQLSSMQKDGVTTVWQRCGYAVLVYRSIKHRRNSPPPLPCCISDSIAAIRCGCVSLLEYVFSMCWPQVVCILCYLLSFPPMCMPFMHFLGITKD